ncbi:hypothetical protein [Goodfellowiella coeruleoviolacea]|uniref:Uncharacterized protein n=1 Tax=Goodfellowiella coeruleoviolacea TaxID=334858 RepID=A0AAE3GHN9_9PSEU|nr:hypothetical protein [Goodfellowiella coeruleoviolacea]MCP2166318.1 hypothetical protein [Goodfellowiella coeruleoviolacea]
MSKDLIWIALMALAGFLIGGAYSMWKTAKPLAVLLGVGALLAGAGAVAWMF